MKDIRNGLMLLGAIGLLAVGLGLAGCKSKPEAQGSSMAAFEEGVPGGTVVDTYQTTATVTSIDPAERKVTMVSPDGKKTTFKAGPEVANFDQIRVGDQVKATLTQQMVVSMGTEASRQNEGATSTIQVAPKGAKPGVLVADTMQVTAKVVGIDQQHHTATLQFPDGSTKTFPVRKDIDLTQRRVGEEVVIRETQTQAISVEKP
ncbi:MAG TPA: hypothetical protein VNT26_18625 [Candidatus Sulfotelmatobacter sp.]|nr:hypothetical protein [Candidatus Sulfotelmatobacter sp.]